jgi:hypothetical protein
MIHFAPMTISPTAIIAAATTTRAVNNAIDSKSRLPPDRQSRLPAKARQAGGIGGGGLIDVVTSDH